MLCTPILCTPILSNADIVAFFLGKHPKDADKSDDVVDPLPLVTYRQAYYVVIMAIKEFLLFSCRLSGSEPTCNLLGHLEKSYLIVSINSCT